MRSVPLCPNFRTPGSWPKSWCGSGGWPKACRGFDHGYEPAFGRHVGNSLEVIEAIEVLKNRSAGDLVDVTLGLGAYMLLLAGRCSEPNEARALLKKQLSSGAGLKKLSQIIAGQGGNPAVIDDYGLFAQPACRLELRATRSGWLTQMDTAAIGYAFVTVGGGRLAKDDPIDSTAGFILPHRLGDPVEEGALIAEIQACDPAKAAKAKKMLQQAIQIGPQSLCRNRLSWMPLTERKASMQTITSQAIAAMIDHAVLTPTSTVPMSKRLSAMC